MRPFLLLVMMVSSVVSQKPYRSYNISSIELSGLGFCPSTEKLREKIRHDVVLFINNNAAPIVWAINRGYGCGGPGWRRAAYLNMSDPTQTCPPAWELITTPRRSCARHSNATSLSCYSAMFLTQSIQCSKVCGRITGYQVGQPEAL